MNRFKKFRLDRGLTQKEFADILGVTETAISRYENNKRTPVRGTILLMTLSDTDIKNAHQKAMEKGLL